VFLKFTLPLPQRKKKRRASSLALFLQRLGLFASFFDLREDRAWRALDTHTESRERAIDRRGRSLLLASDLCCLHRRRIKQVERQRDQNSSERKYGDAAHLRQQVAPSGDKVPRAVYDPRGAAGQGERRLAREERETKLQTTSFFSREKKKKTLSLSRPSPSPSNPLLSSLPPPQTKGHRRARHRHRRPRVPRSR